MTLFSILFVLLIEQFRPLRADNPIYAAIRVFAARIEHSFNAGRPEHGRMAWLAMVSVLVAPTLLIYWLLALVGPLAQFVWSVLIVYLTMGFRHFSHYFTAIQAALNNGELSEARDLLAEWTGQDVRDLDFHDVARIKTSVIHLDLHIRIQLLDRHARRLNFAFSNAIHVVKNLTLKV